MANSEILNLGYVCACDRCVCVCVCVFVEKETDRGTEPAAHLDFSHLN